ncbi:2-oxo acid dehydrogenase subunit E2 [Mariniblastus fucicola]|uniref:Dihydrolipoamide acetyltransferase component of pyruvate dehydrogenase complex n=1 Tax=Mariniblastus fucicola TaxID=980251 RepID=A0A5B9PDM0_9BACT|nr:2-oxo acid dehydrogenase subunit E2 [Mariniblastus fucicola]QEG21131.1 Dihydrolipoyllysine-residue acetyltransferase component of pyruvate dehydrogenase complex [Mariniblastus fucicola]
MPVISVRIPQLGEGLQEALLVDLLKQPGDEIRRDEPIYTMETDKATTDVESPYDGKLVEWLVESGTVLSIGTEIAKMEVAEGVKEMPAGHGPADEKPAAANVSPASSGSSSQSTSAAVRSGAIRIPPKTRRFLKENNLLESAQLIPAAGDKLLVSDVEAWLENAPAAPAVSSEHFDVVPLPKSQIVLNYRLKRGVADCIPVTVGNEMSWKNVLEARAAVKAAGGKATGFAMACFAVVAALKNHDRFRSTLSADERSLQTFNDVNLGVAVALPGDEMVTAVVKAADKMSQQEFFDALSGQIELARDGNDQADSSTTLTVSNIGKAGMRFGIPAIVAPAVATLAFGEIYQAPVPEGDSFRFEPMIQGTLCFDHRLANGVGAANFMNDIKSGIEQFSLDT